VHVDGTAGVLGLGGKPPPVRNATAVAVEVIRQAILSGDLEPGRRLKEADLANELGLSRTPVREALLVLQAEGLIDSFPNRGAVVPERSPEDMLGIYQLRGLLEGHACRLAARSVAPTDIDDLSDSCDRFDAAPDGNVDDLVAENMNFHGIILGLAANPRLQQMVRSVTDLPLIYRTYVWRFADQQRISGEAHRKITRALASGNGERAEMIMREHVLAAGDALVETMSSNR
jgi:DNA-binding GntR family transcriptional regulator